MNFSSSAFRLLPLVTSLFTLASVSLVRSAHAINVNAVYRTACERELGIIIDVQKRELTLLGLDGNVRNIPRYEVVSLAYYPVSSVRIDPARVHQSRPALRISTLLDGRIVPLLDGWPVDFNQERIAFINLEGQEIIVNRDRIWSLDYLEELPSRRSIRPQKPQNFVHPHAVGFCNDTGATPGAKVQYPQQFINDQVVIKRELDRLMQGHQDVREYERDQIFYPRPQLYENRTALGLWTSHGRKHGASADRPNNFTPVLVDELSLGPFGYQHVLVTGAAPMSFSVHTEVQSQIYYRFKAAYFHASAMFDPNLLLVGERYGWSAEELAADRPDIRINEALMVELGFDWGPVALQISPGALALLAARAGYDFSAEEHALFRFGPRISMLSWDAELLAGFSDEEGVPVRWLRLNGGLALRDALEVSASLLLRRMELSAFNDAAESWVVVDRAYAVAAQLHYTLLRRYDIAARGSLESSNSSAVHADGRTSSGRALDAAFSWFVGLRF